MATKDQFDETVSTWLEESAPGRLPERVLAATFDRTRTSRQRHGWRALLGGSSMPRLAAALGTVVVVVVAAVVTVNLIGNRQSQVGPQPSVDRPSSSPAAPSLDLGVFEPVSGRILSGLLSVDPETYDPSAPSAGTTQLRLGPEKVLALGWSADGTRLLFLRQDPTDQSFPYDRHLFVLHADGTETQVTPQPVESAAISPDGSRVVYAVVDDGLFAVDAGGGEPVRIVGAGESPAFSPDGTRIAYLAEGSGEQVWVADADGTDARDILAGGPALAEGASDLAWSPAGDRIAIGNSLEGSVGIYTVAPDGSGLTKVIDGGMNPFWSPDGSQIAYLRPYDGPAPGLAIADADGSNVLEFGFGASGPWHPGPNSPSVEPSVTPPTSGSMWPQASLEEVREAQARADAGDPEVAWQIDPEIANLTDRNIEIVTRFLQEELGWEASVLAQGGDGEYAGFLFVRCAPGGTNGLYPDDEHAGRCAPTIDARRYETVGLDLAQPIRSDPTGIWVVSRWATTAPFEQADPQNVERDATSRLRAFLEARIAGTGAEGYAETGGQREVPLLYGTSTGAPYERYEIDQVGNPRWPFGDREFLVRLFADDGKIVVEQPFRWSDSSLFHDVTQTKENGQPIPLPFAFFGDEVVLTAARPWAAGFERDSLDLGEPWYLSGTGQKAIILVADPLSAGRGCEIGQTDLDARALARSLQSDPDLQVTAPTAVRLGAVDGLQLDVVLAPGASDCEGGSVLRLSDGSDRRGANVAQGTRMRVYLFDLPEGSSMRVLGIAVVAPEASFETVMDAATPVLDSIAIRAGGG